MERRNLDTQGIGKKALLNAQIIIHNSDHLLQPVDSDVDIGIDGYIRIRKKVTLKKTIRNKEVDCEDFVDTGNLIGIQVKGITSIPANGANSYYITLSDKAKFGVNFFTKEALDKKKVVWKNFVGPVILVFVDLATKQSWWADLNSESSYCDGDYFVTVQKSNVFDKTSFVRIKKLGREIFKAKEIPTINTTNGHFLSLGITDFKKSAKEAYENLSGQGEFYFPTDNPVLGRINYTLSGWRHITRRDRRKMRIINSLLLLGVSKEICQTVTQFSKVKKGLVRESKRYIKRVEFLTLRANVNFNFRQSGIVQVVLRRVKTFDKVHSLRSISDQVFFHSVYEPYRKE